MGKGIEEPGDNPGTGNKDPGCPGTGVRGPRSPGTGNKDPGIGIGNTRDQVP